MNAGNYIQFLISGITVGSVYALVGLGFNLIFNATDVINFAQGEFVMIGGAVAAIASKWWGMPLGLAAVLAVVVVGIIGVLIDSIAISRVRGASVMTLVMITLGMSVFLKTGALLVIGPNPLYFPPFSSAAPIHILGAVVQPQALWVIGISGVLMGALYVLYSRSSIGREMIACAVDREAAYLMGINVRRMIRLSFFLSAVLGAVGGVLITPLQNVTYNEGFPLALNGFAAAALGGFGQSSGAVLGGLILGIIDAVAVIYIPSGWSSSVGLAILLLVLIVRPTGLLGGRAERRHTEVIGG